MSKLHLPRCLQKRLFSVNVHPTINTDVNNLLENDSLKHRKHPGIIKPRIVETPKWVTKAIKHVLEDRKIHMGPLKEEVKIFEQHLHGRRIPVEGEELKQKIQTVKERIKEKFPDKSDDIDMIKFRPARILYKQLVYNWQPIEYNERTSLTYLLARGVQDFAVLYRIFNEISILDKDFKPQTLFDFGSGVGTVVWAASQIWTNSIKENFCVDSSAEMNDVAENLAKYAEPKLQGIFYRQFLPVSSDRPYDIVVSAYSLLELPTTETRLQTLAKLWKKTANYLVIVEQGTNAGFKVVNEARDFVLKHLARGTNRNPSPPPAYVFSPCPHDLRCPRYATDDTPCNFDILYYTLPLLGTSKIKTELFSYVVLKKGNRPENDEQWPRIVRPTLNRSKHVICRMCTSSGELKEQIFTKFKHGRNIYRCARSCKWGDRLPLTFEEIKENVT